MAFTNFVPPLLNTEQAGGMPDIIGRMLKGYSSMQHAKYLPQQIEAEIFSKNIGPLANIAISPLAQYMAPQQRRQILSYISQGLGKFGGGSLPEVNQGEGMGSDEGISLAPGGTTEARSKEGIAGQKIINQRFDDLVNSVKAIQNQKGLKGLFNKAMLGAAGAKSPVISILSSKPVRDAQVNLEDALIKYQGYSKEGAHIKAQKALTQSVSDYLSELESQRDVSNQEVEQGRRILRSGVPVGENQNGQIPNNPLPGMPGENAYNSPQEDNELNYAIKLSNDIRDRTGKEIPENLILDYLSRHPGKLNIPKMIKDLGGA